MTNRSVAILCLVCLFVGAALGAWGMHTWSESDRFAAWKVKHELDQEKAKPPQIQTETKTKTEIAYVPKEVVVYRDKDTGKEVIANEKTDVQLNVKPPSVWLKYNSQLFEVPGQPGEKTKFENGKLVGEITTSVTNDVTELVNKEVATRLEKERKHLSISGGYMPGSGKNAGVGWSPNGSLEYEIKKPLDRDGIGGEIRLRF